MAPCHGFTGVVEQWKASTHYVGAIVNNEEVPTWTGPGACGNCHANDALSYRVTGNVGFTGDAGPINATQGQVSYRAPNGSVAEATYKGQARVATIGCITCHDVNPASDPHVTGKAFVPGSFPLRVPSGPNDEMVIEKSPVFGTVTGTPAGKWGVSNTCASCHKSRKDVTHYITASNALTNPYWGPHESPVSDIYSGKGGYHFPGQSYSNASHSQLAGCVSCHMAKVASNGNAPDHSMKPQVSSCKGSGCHSAATSFDVLGGQSTVKLALGELRTLLNNAGWLTRSAAAPYAPLEGTELTDGHLELDRTRAGSGADGGNPVLTANQAGALYNYLVLARGSAWGVHNPVYTKQLIYDSVFVLKGSAPAAILTRPQ
jgi:trimeric autotransporter adhesin